MMPMGDGSDMDAMTGAVPQIDFHGHHGFSRSTRRHAGLVTSPPLQASDPPGPLAPPERESMVAPCAVPRHFQQYSQRIAHRIVGRFHTVAGTSEMARKAEAAWMEHVNEART